MYAVVRLNSFDPSKLSASSDTLDQFDRVHAAQPGFLGTVVVDLQAGRRLVVNLWESEGRAAEALSVLGPEVRRLLNPLMSNPSELLGAGTVISTDLTPSTGA